MLFVCNCVLKTIFVGLCLFQEVFLWFYRKNDLSNFIFRYAHSMCNPSIESPTFVL